MPQLMSLGLSPPERRSINPAPVSPEAPAFNLEWLMGRLDTSDVTVNASTVKQIASVAASIRLITSSLCALPLNVFAVESQRRVPAHSAFRLINRAPNDEQTVSQLLTAFVESALLHGNAYLQLTRNPTTKAVDGLWLLNPGTVSAKRVGTDNRLIYETLEGGKRQTLVPFRDIIHVTGAVSLADGVTGISPLVESREVFAKGLAIQKFTSRFFANFATPAVVLKTPKLVKPELKNQMRNDWEALQSGKHQHRVGVLDNDLDIEVIGSSLKDNDLTELASAVQNECASIFGVDPSLVGSASKTATNASLVEMNLQFLRYTLGPWLTRIEQALTRALCDDKHVIRFDTHSLLRMDPRSQSEVAMTLRQAGAITTAEARQIGAGLEPLGNDDDDIVLAQVNMTSLPNLTKTLPSQMKGATDGQQA